jgi:alpha-beta hydrolase superfamily lysophospholipase
MAARDKRISAIVPIQPGGRVAPEVVAAQTAPMLLLSGGADVTTPPQRAQAPIFEGAKSPVFWATLKAATHTTPVNRETPYAHAALAFFDWRLKGLAQAAEQFEGEACALCRNPDWEIRRR